MTSRIDQTSVGRREPDCVCKGWRPKEWLEPGPGAAAAIDSRPPPITKSTVCFSCARDTRVCRLREALRPVLRHDRIVHEIAVRVLSSKVSIPVVILCDRVQREHRLAEVLLDVRHTKRPPTRVRVFSTTPKAGGLRCTVPPAPRRCRASICCARQTVLA